jgi:hypothetical protein
MHSGGTMDHETIGKTKYFISDKEQIIRDGFDKNSELIRLEKLITRSKNSFMMAANQLHLLNDIGFVFVSGYHRTPITNTFITRFQIQAKAHFTYIRTVKNKTVTLFFSDFGFTSESNHFFYVSMKIFQDNDVTLGNGKMPFIYQYDDAHNAEPVTIFKHVDGFIERNIIVNHYTSYDHSRKTYYPINSENPIDFYLYEAVFNIKNKAINLTYKLYEDILPFYKIQRMIPDFEFDMNALAKRKVIIDDGYAELIKMLDY